MDKIKLMKLIWDLAEQLGYDWQWYHDLSCVWDVLNNISVDCYEYQWILVISSARIDSSYDDSSYLTVDTAKLEHWWRLSLEEYEWQFDSIEEIADQFIARDNEANKLLKKYRIKVASFNDEKH